MRNCKSNRFRYDEDIGLLLDQGLQIANAFFLKLGLVWIFVNLNNHTSFEENGRITAFTISFLTYNESIVYG